MKMENSKKHDNDNARNKKSRNKPRPRYASIYPKHLQGLASNQYGGTNLRHQVGYRGAKYGKAGPVKIFTPDEIVEYANDNKLAVAKSVLAKAKKPVTVPPKATKASTQK
ncbi:MAG: hypothetical protein KDA46_12340 [Parvularculaceae bacterium]|nr:hypothetical protein [Parvularculaceae bacterium]